MTLGTLAGGQASRLVARLRSSGAGLGLGRAGDAGRWPVLWYGLYTLALFTFCFIVGFPHELLLQRLLQHATAGTPFRIETGTARLHWTLAYSIDSLRVRADDGEAEPLLLAESLLLSPSRLGLWRGNPFPLGIDVSLYGGTLRGTVDPRPERFRVEATLEGVDLARYTGLRPWVEGRIRGRAAATLALDGGSRGPAAAAGSIDLRLPGLALESTKLRGITVPDLHFDDVHLTGTVKNGRLEISELLASGDELVLRGDGSVVLREPSGSSVLSLDLVVTPGRGAPDGLRVALNMIPGKTTDEGARRFSLVGTLARPTVR